MPAFLSRSASVLTNRKKPFPGLTLLFYLLLVFLWTAQDGQAFGNPPLPPSGKGPLIEGADSRSRRFEKLRARALEKGTAEVILRLDTPFVPEGRLGAAGDVALQRRAIFRDQERLLATLAGYPVKNIKKFDYIPFVALELPAESLDRLEGETLVVDIEEDTRSAPAWTNSIDWIGADRAWQYGYTGTDWTVAVLDTGVEINHPYFQGRIVGGACFSNLCGAPAGINCNPGSYGSICNHGTYISGIIAADGGSADHSGVAKGAQVIPVQIFSDTGDGGIDSAKSSQLQALQYVYSLKDTYKIAAVNMSVHGELHGTQASCDAANPSVKAMFDLLRSAGIAPVMPSGNDGSASALAYPACISSAVSVGGTYAVDEIAGFSDSAPFLDLLAPGAGVCSTTFWAWGGWACEYAGTSLAAPQVSGTWAVLKQAVPKATVDDILSVLRSTGVPVADPRNGLTTPRIQVDAALKRLLAKPQTQLDPLPTSVTTTTFGLSWSGSTPLSGPLTYDLQVRDGYRTDCTPECPWTDLLTGSSQTSLDFTGVHGHTYFFRVRARDRLNNLEPFGGEEWGQTFTTVLTSPAPVLVTSFKSGAPALFAPGQDLTYTITLRNTGTQNAAVAVEDVVPPVLTVNPLSPAASSGASPLYAGGNLTWAGTIPSGGEVRVTYSAVADPQAVQFFDVVTNTARISGGVLGDIQRSASLTKAYGLWQPFVSHLSP